MDFVRISFWSGIATVVKILTGIVSIKIVAQIIGPAGIAMVGQWLNAITMISTAATGGIGQGVTKYVAQYYDRPALQKEVIAQAFRITIAATIFISLTTIIFSSPLTQLVFKDRSYRSLVILLGATLFLYSLNSLLLSILNGFKGFRKFITVNIVISLTSLCASLLLTIWFRLYGALLSAIVSQTIVIFITLIMVRKEHWFRNLFPLPGIDWKLINYLGAFTLMTIVSAFTTPLSQMIVRGHLDTVLGANQAGLWESINRISAMMLLLITTSITTYYLPRLAEIREDRTMRVEVLKIGKLVLPTLALICLLSYVLRDFIIMVLFSREFYPMRDLFAFQMIGNFFKIASFLLGYLYWAKGMTRSYILTELFFSTSFVIFSLTFVKWYGIQGPVYAYALNYFLLFITLLFVFRKIFFLPSKPKDHPTGG